MAPSWHHAEIVGIAIDGKTSRRSHDRWHGIATLHTITTWAKEAGVALGQRKVVDHARTRSVGCQRDLAVQLVPAEADDVLALKGNQPETAALV